MYICTYVIDIAGRTARPNLHRGETKIKFFSSKFKFFSQEFSKFHRQRLAL